MTDAPRGHADVAWVDVSRRRAWWAVSIGWGLLQLVILALCLFWGGVAGVSVTWSLLPHLLGIRHSVNGLAVGFLTGLAVGLIINHKARMWVRRARLRRLRRRGSRATARVAAVDRQHRSVRGSKSTSYVVRLQWIDPATRTGYRCRRWYRFAGSGSAAFEKACSTGAEVTVWFPPGRPSRAVVDIPFAPVMADLLF
ncbi:DUF3592 domain-containing protein [Actinoallomurus sp. NPDC050550]|uniref:DUF3592 domain-containing protein n=1 Tax=Actinoallomurus sp. NPDC050550 TaxID=3154937 RepID=UPI0033D945D6